MVDSSISSSHYYYIALFDNTVVSKADLVNLYNSKNSKRSIVGGQEIIHTQKIYSYSRSLGSLDLLTKRSNKDEGTDSDFWYDYYIGEVLLKGKKLLFVCFPYKKMQTWLVKNPLFKNALYYVPHVPRILERMEEQKGQEKIGEIKNEITKYTALVKETKKAERIHILGRNPLDSSIYESIKGISGIKVRASSLKLKCSHDKKGQIEVSFDKYGNFRFWLPRERSQEELVELDLQETDTEYVQALNMIPTLYKTFDSLKFLDTTNKLSTYNTLEEE